MVAGITIKKAPEEYKPYLVRADSDPKGQITTGEEAHQAALEYCEAHLDEKGACKEFLAYIDKKSRHHFILDPANMMTEIAVNQKKAELAAAFALFEKADWQESMPACHKVIKMFGETNAFPEVRDSIKTTLKTKATSQNENERFLAVNVICDLLKPDEISLELAEDFLPVLIAAAKDPSWRVRSNADSGAEELDDKNFPVEFIRRTFDPIMRVVHDQEDSCVRAAREALLNFPEQALTLDQKGERADHLA